MAEDITPTPLDAVNHMYNSAPKVIRPLLDESLRELIATIIPRVAALTQFGGTMSIDELRDLNLGASFSDAIEEAEAAGASIPKHLTPTVREIGREIGEEIDSRIGRVLITHDESYVNRDAHLDIIAGHALIVRGLGGLTAVPEGLGAEEASA